MKRSRILSTFKRITSFVLALVILTSMFTVSGVVVSAEAESDTVNIYVKTENYTYVSNGDDTYSEMLEAGGCYTASVPKGENCTIASFNPITSMVYFIKPSDWEGTGDLYAHFWDKDNNLDDVQMYEVKENLYYLNSDEQFQKYNGDLYYATIEDISKYTEVVFHTGSSEYDYTKQTNDLDVNDGAIYDNNSGGSEYASDTYSASTITIPNVNEDTGVREDLSEPKNITASQLSLSVNGKELDDNNTNEFNLSEIAENAKFEVPTFGEDFNISVSKDKLSDLQVGVISDVKVSVDGFPLSKTYKVKRLNPSCEVSTDSDTKLFNGKYYTTQDSVKVYINGIAADDIDKVSVSVKESTSSPDEAIATADEVKANEIKRASDGDGYYVELDTEEVGEKTYTIYFDGTEIGKYTFVRAGFKNVQYFDINGNELTEGKFTNKVITVKFSLVYPDVDDINVKVDDSEKSLTSEDRVYYFTTTSNNTIKVTSNDFAGISYVTSAESHYDNTAPKITNVKFTSAGDSNKEGLAKVLNFLTFGIYSNNKINVTVTAKDSLPSSGLSGINVTGNENTIANNVEGTEIAAENDSVAKEYSFVINENDIEFSKNAKDIKFTVSDNVGNKTEKTLEALLLDKVVEGFKDVNYKNEDLSENLKNFEVVSTKQKPTAGSTTFEGKYSDENNKNIVSGNTVTITSTVTDTLSGINSIETPKLYYKDDNDYAEVTDATVKFESCEFNGNDVSVNSFDALNKLLQNDKETNYKVTKLEFTYTVTTDETGEYSVSYTATNNSGNTSEATNDVFYVDNTAPEITKVEFTSADDSNKEGLAKVLNFLTFGIYSNNKINVTVTATDSKPSSGFDKNGDIKGTDENDKTVVENNGFTKTKAESNASEATTIQYQFVLDNAESAYKLKFKAWDNAGNATEEISLADLLNAKNSDGDYIVENYPNGLTDTENFEVVSTKQKPIAESTTFKGKKYSDKTNVNIVSGETVTITSTVTDTLSGINSITIPELYFEGKKVTDAPVKFERCEFNGNYVSVTSFDALNTLLKDDTTTNYKVTELTFTYTVTTDETGEYSVSYTATNNSGNTSEATNDVFYVDNTAPEITKVEFTSADDSNKEGLAKVLNFLTFGIYSNNKINVTVTATDSKPSSGFDKNGDIKGTDENDKTVVENNGFTKTKAESNASEATTIQYQFVLDNAESAYKLKFKAWDNAGNATEEISLIKLIEADKVSGYENVDIDSENFEVVSVSTEKKPTIVDIEVSDPDYKEVISENEMKYWYKADKGDADKSAVKFSTTVTDGLSKLHSIKGTENDKVVSLKDKNRNDIKEFTETLNTDNKNGNSVSEQYVSYTMNENSNYSGKYTLTVTAVNNSGNQSDASKTVYFDSKAPVIKSVEFEDASEYSDKTVELKDTIEKTNYGYFFKKDTKVTVTAEDVGDANSASDVKKIVIVTQEKGSGKDVSKEFDPSEASEATLLIPANFKGNVYAYAIDNVGNKGDKYYPNKVVVENEQMHNDCSSISISTNESTSKTDKDGRALFNTDVNVPIVVTDTYSGIAKIEYSVESSYDTGNNYSATVTADSKDDGWNRTKKDENLVTEMTTTLKVANNSNNIKVYVKLTDNAGNTSEEEIYFSIDKTAPEITVEYDNNSATSHNGTDYFKANRTATVTVKERNFNSDDVVYKITNTDEVIPTLSGWTEHWDSTNPDNSYYTATVTYSADGDYTFDFSYTDLAGNQGNNIKQHKFTLDKTMPEISVEFDNNSSLNSNYYKADRIATITVNEHNFNAEDVKVAISATAADNSTSATPPSVSGWSNNGDTHTATVRFTNDGKYSFTVDYTDLADNAAKQEVVSTFYVDKTTPVVEISNIENNSANAGDVAPVVTFKDNNYSGDYKLTLTRVDINAKTSDVSRNFVTTVVPTGNTGATITYSSFANIEENDGIYVLNAELTDRAGNSESAMVTFSVNRFGSTYAYGTDDTKNLVDNGYTNAEKDIVISEINVDKLTKSSVTLSVDNSELKTLEPNKDYTIKEDAKTGQWHKYDYTIKSGNFADEGSYTIEISSIDQAKNSATNRIPIQEDRKLAVQFIVDKTAPVVNIAGIEDNKLYQESSKDVTIVCEDSHIDSSSLVISLDDKVLKEGEDYVLEKDVATLTATLKVNATSDISAQSIKVIANDLAGNEGEGQVDKFTLSATLLMRFFANTPLVIITAVLLTAIIGGVVFIVIKRKKKIEE